MISTPPIESIVEARWLSPDCSNLLSPGCIHIRDGRILRVWEGSDACAVKLGDVAIVPGLINAHTHLEFSDLTRPLSPTAAFPDWIRAVVAERRRRPPGEASLAAIRRGWRECADAGTVALGEIATSDDTAAELDALGARGVVFREVLGLRDEDISRGIETADAFLSMPHRGPMVRGLSPHAPYSLHPDLFRGLVNLAVEADAPVAMHLAETREELELLSRRRGGLVELLSSFGLWRSELFEQFRRPLDYLRELSRCRRVCIVHGNYLDDDETDFLAARPQMSVVYCPRTHAAFRHAPHPWRAMRERGVRVVFGTDSRASNPDLSLLNELRWLRQSDPRISPKALLRMATADAAEALGVGSELGELTPGKIASVSLISPTRPISPNCWDGLL